MISLCKATLGRWSVELGLEPRDAWVGFYFKREALYGFGHDAEHHVYFCALPFLVVHVKRSSRWAAMFRVCELQCTCCRECQAWPCSCGFMDEPCPGRCICEELAACPGRS